MKVMFWKKQSGYFWSTHTFSQDQKVCFFSSIWSEPRDLRRAAEAVDRLAEESQVQHDIWQNAPGEKMTSSRKGSLRKV